MSRKFRLRLLWGIPVPLAWFLLRAQAPQPASDYLSPQLRAQVERLKQQAETEPTSQRNLVERALILWDWVNAYSLTGGPVPVAATQELGAVFQLQEEGAARAILRPAVVDRLLYEFRIKDEHPRAIPALRLDRSGPFPASSWQTIAQTLACGDVPMPEGSTFMLARMLMADGGGPQIDNLAGDNYVSIHSSNPRARFARVRIPWSGIHGGLRGVAQNPGYRLEGAELQPGDTVTLVYGDRSGGSRGYRMQSFSNDRFLLPVYVSFKPDGPMLTPAWPAIRVEGNGLYAVKIFAPSMVRAGERFELSVRSEDEHWNRATGAIPAYEVTLDGAAVGAIRAGSEAVAVLHDVHIDRPGTYRFHARSADGKLSGESNPVWVEADPKYRIYWGETHAHSGFSEGMGSIDGFYTWGRDDARLDFLGLSEHDIWTDAGEWRSMQEAVRRYTVPGRYIAFLAYEWTAQRPMGGHHNVFFRTPAGQRAPVQMAYTLSRLYQALRASNRTSDVLIIPHAHQAGDWRRNDPDMERLAEIMSTHGTFEWFGNYYLKNGYEIGFVAASDDHRTRPGYSGTMRAGSLQQFGGLAAVRAPEKTADAIFDALRARQTYAVTGAQRILLDVSLNGQPGGRRIAAAAERRLHARFSGTAPLDRVEVIRNGEVAFTRRFAAGRLEARARVQIGFRSGSEAFGRDNPRGYRHWSGALEVEGAQLAAVHPYFDNRSTEFARQSGNRVEFSVDTRGGMDAMVLELEGASPATRIAVKLEQSAEFGASPQVVRPAAVIPAARLEFPFTDLKDGLLVRELPVGRHTDAVSVQVLDPNAPRDGELDFADRGAAGAGDYYYVRLTQIDGAHAWSSPVWVGGEPPR